MNTTVDLSVIIPVTEPSRSYQVQELYHEYKEGIEQVNLNYEMIYVLDGEFPRVYRELMKLKKSGEKIKILKLAKWFGEATAIMAGFELSKGKIIMTLPAYYQIDPSGIPQMINVLENQDMVISRRWPRKDSLFNRLQSNIFHFMVKFITGLNFHDLGNTARVFKRKVLEEIQLYGDLHRFLPLLAYRYGFKIKEVQIAQSQMDAFQRIHHVGVYIRRLLDLTSVFFLIKFTKKPLRFFGLLGTFVFFWGAVLGFYLFVQRVFFGIALADRPIVLVSLLLIVVGVQIFAIGLIGEIIIFTHAKELKEYTIEEIVN